MQRADRHWGAWALNQLQPFWCEGSSVLGREEHGMSLAKWGRKKGLKYFLCKWSSVQGHMGLKGMRIATGEKPGDLLLLGKMESPWEGCKSPSLQILNCLC